MTGPTEQDARRLARETSARQSDREVEVLVGVVEAALAETEDGPADV